MAPFVNLFNNQLQPATVFSENFTSANVATLLCGIRDDPATYGLDDTAATVAGAFVDAQGKLIMIIPNPITVNNMDICDIGAALGYLFSCQPIAQQNLETGYRPVLHAYGRVLQTVRKAFPMSAVMFDPTTSRWFFGTTIPVFAADPDRKVQVQADRLRQLRAALLLRNVPLPPLPQRALRELAMQLSNVKVPDQVKDVHRTVPPDKHQLYERLLTTLVTNSSGTYPMTLTFTTDLTQFNTALQNIINEEPPEWEVGIRTALTAGDALRMYLEEALANATGPEFGHCAESFPFIRILRDVANRAPGQGLAVVPKKMVKLNPQQITTGTESYNTSKTFRYPCENCKQVLLLAGMTQGVFDTYITEVVSTFDQDIT